MTYRGFPRGSQLTPLERMYYQQMLDVDTSSPGTSTPLTSDLASLTALNPMDQARRITSQQFQYEPPWYEDQIQRELLPQRGPVPPQGRSPIQRYPYQRDASKTTNIPSRRLYPGGASPFPGQSGAYKPILPEPGLIAARNDRSLIGPGLQQNILPSVPFDENARSSATLRTGPPLPQYADAPVSTPPGYAPYFPGGGPSGTSQLGTAPRRGAEDSYLSWLRGDRPSGWQWGEKPLTATEAYGVSIAANMIPTHDQPRLIKGGGSFGGVAKGAAMGSPYGPYGTAIGGTLGLLGAFDTKSPPEQSRTVWSRGASPGFPTQTTKLI